jgi:hypothetical protein
MTGAGRIFRWYRDGALIDDSEVALLHADAEHGYRALTVPLVNVRWSAERCLPPRDAAALVLAAARIFYQDRTLPRVLELVPARWRKRFRMLDLKADDAREVLHAARAARPLPVRPRFPPASSLVRRRRLAATAALPPTPDDGALRRALLAGWAREMGLTPSPDEVVAARSGIRSRAPADVIARLAQDIALERLVLAQAPRLLNDGPSREEADAQESRARNDRRRLRGRLGAG